MARSVQSVVFRLFLLFLFSPTTFLSVWLGSPEQAQGQVPAATIGVGEYRYPPAIDPDILASRPTELWAKVHYPQNIEARMPVVVFLHGNHATCGRGGRPRIDDNCQYTMQGTCPAGYEVVPSHAGYDYIARELADHGFFVVSINANLGINCGGGEAGDPALNFARAKLILKHLELLKDWNSGDQKAPPEIGAYLRGRLDLEEVGLVGHSRAGEAVRIAYTMLRENRLRWGERLTDQVQIKGIFEIGGADGQSIELFEASGVTWAQLVPMCDGDLYQLPGVRPYDRMLKDYHEEPAAQKTVLTVWGTNHNYYNTEWQEGDSSGCLGHRPIFQPIYIPPDLPTPGPTPVLPEPASGSLEQQLVGKELVSKFFRAHVGKESDERWNSYFNPRHLLPDYLTGITRIERAYTPSSSFMITPVVEDFSQSSGISVYGPANAHQGITVAHSSLAPHDPVQRVAAVYWQQAGRDRFLQLNPLSPGSGVDISGFESLDIRLARRRDPLNNGFEETTFSVALEIGDGERTRAVDIGQYTSLRGPVGGPLPNLYHSVLHTVRIPLQDFSNELRDVRAVRFIFDRTPRGAILIGEVRLSAVDDLFDSPSGDRAETSSITQRTEDTEVDQPLAPISERSRVRYTGGSVERVEVVSSDQSSTSQREVELTLRSTERFRVGGELLTLRIGSNSYVLSRFPEDGDLRSAIFTVPEDVFLQRDTNQELVVKYGKEDLMVWEFQDRR